MGPRLELRSFDEALDAWHHRYDAGIDYWKNQIPGLALLYRLIQEGKRLPDELVGAEEEIKIALGLGYLACQEPHDWGGSHLPVGTNYQLMAAAVGWLENNSDDQFAVMFQKIGDALNALETMPPFEEHLDNIEVAYAVVGQRGAGKGTVLSEMEKLGVCTAASSRGLREVMRVILKRDATTPELVEMGQRFKILWGFDIFTKMILWEMMHLPRAQWQQIAIDGLRTDEEIEMFRNQFGERSRVIAVIRPGTETDEQGWQVIQARQAQTGKKEYDNFEAFVATQQKERDRIAGLVELADIVIVNDGSLENLQEKIKALFPLPST